MKYKKVLSAAMLVIAAFLCVSSEAQSEYLHSDLENVGMEVYSCEKVVALTFDDGPRRSTTIPLLDGLKERGVHATFFVVGKNIEGNEDVIQRMEQEGHLIGNHTFTHVELTTLSHQAALTEITKTNDSIAAITGKTPTLIRPPFGSYNEKIREEINMNCVLWNIDPVDWNTTNVSKVVNRVVNNVSSSPCQCNNIILMHDIFDSSVAAALEIVDQLQAKGYVFVTADQVMLD